MEHGRRWLAVFLLVPFVTSLFLNMVLSDGSVRRSGEEYMVTKVIDGDTLIIEGGRRVRLLGIDSAEREKPCYRPASLKLEEMVLDREVELVSTGDEKDTYGRLLRYVFLNGTNINLEMVRQGYAVARTDGAGRFADRIVEAESRAMEENRGCEWSESDTDVSICGLEESAGSSVTVSGEVSGYSDVNGTVFLNFGGEYPNNCFTAVVWRPEAFDGLNGSIEGRSVSISGEVDMYDGTPEIEVNRRSQLDWRQE